MDLNLYILQYELGEVCVGARISHGPEELTCTHPLLYVPWMEFFSGPVYVAAAGDLPEEPPMRANLICVGEPPAPYVEGVVDYLVVDGAQDALAVLARVVDAYARYGQWARQLDHLVEERRPLRDLALASSRVFGNPLSLWSSGFRSMFYVAGELVEQSEVRGVKVSELKRTLVKFKDNQLLPLEDVRAFAMNESFAEIARGSRPAVFDGGAENFPCRALIYPLSRHDDVRAYLIVDEVNRAITDRDAACAVILGAALRRLLPSAGPGDVSLHVLDNVLEDLMGSVSVDPDRMASAFEAVGWLLSDEFVVVAASGHSAAEGAGHRLSQVFADRSSRLVRPLVGATPALLVNRTQAGPQFDDMARTLLAGLSLRLDVIGQSDGFADLRDLPHFYDQALFALESARGAEGELRKYRDCYLDDMVRRAAGSRSKTALLPEGLRRLLAHDEMADDNLVDLLRLYLRCNLNMTKAARLAFVHRNTYLAKMKRAQEIGTFNLEDADTVLGLRIALEIIEL